MAHDVISTCPVCQGELTITRLHCNTCGTALEGEFGVGRFGHLLRARGNLKEMERELGISYPTVRNRLEALLRTLGLADGEAAPVSDEEPASEAESAGAAEPAADDPMAAERRAILEQLKNKELTADEAAARLRSLGRS